MAHRRMAAATWLVVMAVLAALSLATPDSVWQASASTAGGSLPEAAWDSGWVPIGGGDSITFDHGLGGDVSQYAIQLWFLDTGPANFGVNTRAYGGLEANGVFYGAYWDQLDTSSIRVYRHEGDTFADLVRVWIWVPDPQPDWCSNWTAVAQGATHTFAHNLGGNVQDYVVGLWFQAADGQESGINQVAYGGMEANGEYQGAFWHNLTNTQVLVHRAEDDPYADQVRVCITIPDPPDWDSSWTAVAPGQTVLLDHHLGCDPGSYVVRAEMLDTSVSGLGIHNENVGGNVVYNAQLGVNWQNLTGGQISVFRRTDDERSDMVRMRIWARQKCAYLPLVLHEE